MKNLNFLFGRAILLLVVCFCLSCQKDKPNIGPDGSSFSNGNEAQSQLFTTVFTAAEHTFTDIHICYDDKVFLLENGRLKRLIGTDLVDVNLPASVYTDFNPTYLAISKDFTFYLRAANGIKVIKGGKVISYYKVGLPPLQDFTEQDFGNLEIGVDETNKSVIFGIVRSGFDPILFSLAKITKDGQFSNITTRLIPGAEATEFITTFDISGTPGQLWISGLGAFNSTFFSYNFNFSLATPPNGYQLIKQYGLSPTNRGGPPIEGPIDSVRFEVLGGLLVSKDTKTLYLKSGGYGEEENPGDPGVSNTGNLFKVFDGQVKLIASNIENKRMAISNNGKTLYLAGKGLIKTEF